MEECFKCGISESQTLLFDAISGKEIVKICRKCSFRENMPLIRKPILSKLDEVNKRKTVYERLSDAAGIGREDRLMREKRIKEEIERKELLKKKDISLKDLVEKNFEKNLANQGVREKTKQRTDLVDNFHWIIMRARRRKKITADQLAKAIREPEDSIKKAESGILPAGDYGRDLARKIELALNVKILRDRIDFKVYRETSEKEVDFNDLSKNNLSGITISDLKEIEEKKREKELIDKGNLENDFDGIDVQVFDNEEVDGQIDVDEADIVRDEDLTQEEINELIFRKD